MIKYFNVTSSITATFTGQNPVDRLSRAMGLDICDVICNRILYLNGCTHMYGFL